MKMISCKELYNNAVSVFGFKKVAITLMSGFTGWCVCTTTALLLVPDNPQVIEKPVAKTAKTVTKNIVEKENV